MRFLNIQHSHLLICLWAFLIGSSGLKWIPLIDIGPIAIEIHNAVTLSLVAVTGYQLFTRKFYRVPPFLMILCLLCLWLTLVLALHGTIAMSPIVLTLPVVLGAFAFVNFGEKTIDALPQIALLSQAVIICGFLISIAVSGVDFIGGLTSYLTSSNRLGFLIGTIRPIFNAFTPALSGGDTPIYDSWLLNHLSASLYLTFALAVSARPKKQLQAFGLIASALFSVFFLLSLFSSSVIMALFYAFCVLMVKFAISRNSRFATWLVLSFLLFTTVTVAPVIYSYLSQNVASDAGSASSRLEQYVGALEGIAESPIIGVGMRTFHNHTVHNLFLASFMMTGIIGGLLSGALFVIAISYMIEGWQGLLKRDEKSGQLYMLLALFPMIFITRAGLAGGFGLPSNAEVFALAVAYMARRRLRSQTVTQSLQMPARTAGAPQSSWISVRQT